MCHYSQTFIVSSDWISHTFSDIINQEISRGSRSPNRFIVTYLNFMRMHTEYNVLLNTVFNIFWSSTRWKLYLLYNYLLYYIFIVLSYYYTLISLRDPVNQEYYYLQIDIALFYDFRRYLKSVIFLFSIANKCIFIKSLWWYIFIEESHRIKMFGSILKINEKYLYLSERS